MTREQWLNEAVGKIRPMFVEAGFALPEIKVSCGWPSKGALSEKKRRIGECWPAEAAKDKVTQVFISPYLDDVAGVGGVLATLVHELLHAAIGCKHGHKAPFKRAMVKVGLVGKATATEADDKLMEKIAAWTDALGPYPNAALDPLVVAKLRKKQSTRLIKCECPECGYLCRTTKKWIDDVGAPHCPKHGETKAEPSEGSEEESDNE